MTIETPTRRTLTDVPSKTHTGNREESGGLAQLDVCFPLITISARIDRYQMAKLKITLTDASKPFPDFETVPFGTVRVHAFGIHRCP